MGQGPRGLISGLLPFHAARFPRLVPGLDFKSSVDCVTTIWAGSIPVPRRQQATLNDDCSHVAGTPAAAAGPHYLIGFQSIGSHEFIICGTPDTDPPNPL